MCAFNCILYSNVCLFLYLYNDLDKSTVVLRNRVISELTNRTKGVDHFYLFEQRNRTSDPEIVYKTTIVNVASRKCRK